MEANAGQSRGALHIEQLRARLAPLRASLLRHPVYRQIHDQASLRRFMEHHVFAVWDFMSLLKALQRRICCNEIPWLPPTDHVGARFINEIVLAEESDADRSGGFISHFSLYLRAMSGCGADTSCIDRFLTEVQREVPVSVALDVAGVPGPAKTFVRRTFSVVESGDLCTLAATFTFGREDLLPQVFEQLVNRLAEVAGGGLDDLQYYLHRHIALDGDEHGPLATRLVQFACEDDENRWEVATRAAIATLEARRELWDGVCVSLAAGQI
jgi:hypothetical protein